MAESQRICSVEGCGKPRKPGRRGFCEKHYQRQWKYGDPTVCKNLIGVYGPVCAVDGCGEKHHAHGFCTRHAFRFKMHGDPLAGGPFTARRGEHQRWLERAAKYEGDDCLLWPFGQRSWYGQTKWKGRPDLAHRVVCETVNGPAPSGDHVAAHSCGKGHLGCVSPKHLRWATAAENEADKEAHGTRCRGESRPAAKLIESEVRQIRALRGIEAQVRIAKRFGISQGTVSKVQLRQAWAWLED